MPRTRSCRSAWAPIVPVLLVLGCRAALGQSEAESLSASFRAAARRVLPAVVTVRVAPAPGPAAPVGGLGPAIVDPVGSPRDGGGSGVVIDAAGGLVLTNDHVVLAGARIVVTLPDGRQRLAREVRRDPKSDLAVLTIDPEGLQQAEWGDSEALDTGDWVLAIGQPFGLSGTVTAGIVSGKGRGLGETTYYEDLIQTDAAINPGNSGGPLVNLKGQVVGINAVIKTIGGGYEGVGFAVPAARARRIAAELVEVGRVRRAAIGAQIGRIDPEAAVRLGRPGAVPITTVAPGGPAAEAGLRPGDVVVAVGGRPVQGIGMLQAAIEIAPVGEPLTLTVVRDAQTRDLAVRPAPQADALGLPVPPASPGESSRRPPPEAPPPAPREELEARTPTRFPALGLRLEGPTPALVERFGLDSAARGLVVVGVEPDGPADRGGLELGMVITDVADRRVASLSEFRAALARRPPGRDLVLRILKGSKAEFRVLLQGVAQ
jgi:serine protease Do